MKKTRTLLILPALCLAVACGKPSPQEKETAGQAAASAEAAGKKSVMQDAMLVRTTDELQRDSLNLLRIGTLALQDKPAYATPREAVEAFMQAYVSADAPLMFHVCEVGFGPVEPQQVLDYQHMMEGLSRAGSLPAAFTVTEVGEQGGVCPVMVDLVMPDGATQAMRAEAVRLPGGLWRPLLK